MARTHKVPGKIKHSEHDHPQTKHFAVLCRKHMIETGEPLVTEEQAGLVEPMPIRDAATYETPQQRGARTRARNRKAAEEALVIEATGLSLDGEDDDEVVVDEGERDVPHRNSRGRFTRDTLNQWTGLLDSIDSATDFLTDQGAPLLEARLVTTLGGQTIIATYSEDGGWSVEVVAD